MVNKTSNWHHQRLLCAALMPWFGLKSARWRFYFYPRPSPAPRHPSAFYLMRVYSGDGLWRCEMSWEWETWHNPNIGLLMITQTFIAARGLIYVVCLGARLLWRMQGVGRGRYGAIVRLISQYLRGYELSVRCLAGGAGCECCFEPRRRESPRLPASVRSIWSWGEGGGRIPLPRPAPTPSDTSWKRRALKEKFNQSTQENFIVQTRCTKWDYFSY